MSRQAARTAALTASVAPEGLVASGAPSAAAGSQPALDNTLAKIAAYIPSEVVATYLAVVGVWQPDTDAQRWGCFAVGMGTLALLAYLGWAMERRSAADQDKASLGHLAWVFVLGAVSFTTYTMATPGSAFVSAWSDATKFGGCAALVLAVLLPSIGQVVGVDPDA